jgi:hypothetical protein
VSFLNDEFETEGAVTGDAKNWDVGIQIGRYEVAAAGADDGWPGIERFETDWDNEDWSDELLGVYDGPVEDFEGGWDNDNWSTDFIAIEQATLGGTAAPEGFETLWDNDDWSDTLVGVDPRQFDATIPEPHEDFEEEWSNDDWSDTLTGTEAKQFHTGTPVPYEDFEVEWPELVMATI